MLFLSLNLRFASGVVGKGKVVLCRLSSVSVFWPARYLRCVLILIISGLSIGLMLLSPDPDVFYATWLADGNYPYGYRILKARLLVSFLGDSKCIYYIFFICSISLNWGCDGNGCGFPLTPESFFNYADSGMGLLLEIVREGFFASNWAKSSGASRSISYLVVTFFIVNCFWYFFSY